MEKIANNCQLGQASNLRAEYSRLIVVSKIPKISSWDTHVALLNVQDTIIRKNLHKLDLRGRYAGRKPLLSKDTRVRLHFAYGHPGKERDLWNNVLWIAKAEIELFDHSTKSHVWQKPKKAFTRKKNLISAIKHGGENVRVWGCFVSSGSGQLPIIESL